MTWSKFSTHSTDWRSHYSRTNAWDQFTGGLQERHDRDRVRPPGGRETETEGGRSSNLDTRHTSKPLKMVGFGCGCSHSLSVQTAVFLDSQVEGESYPCFPYLLYQENSSPSPAAAFVPENAAVPFQEASRRPFLVFSRGPQLSTSLNHLFFFGFLLLFASAYIIHVIFPRWYNVGIFFFVVFIELLFGFSLKKGYENTETPYARKIIPVPIWACLLQ